MDISHSCQRASVVAAMKQQRRSSALYVCPLVLVLDVRRVDIKAKRNEVVEKDSIFQRQHVEVDKLRRWPDKPFYLVDGAAFTPELAAQLGPARLL